VGVGGEGEKRNPKVKRGKSISIICDLDRDMNDTRKETKRGISFTEIA